MRPFLFLLSGRHMKRIILTILILASSFNAALTQAATIPALTSTVKPSTFYAAGGVAYSGSVLAGFRYAFSPFMLGLNVGSTLIGMGVYDALNSIRLQAGNNTPWPVPAGWTDSNTPPLIQATGSNYCYFPINLNGVGYQAMGPDYITACTDQGGVNTPNGQTYGACVKSTGSPTFNSVIQCQTQASNLTNRCGPGYGTLNGHTCILYPDPSGTNDYPKWPSDGVPSLKNNPSNANQWMNHPRDPDSYATSPIASPFTRLGVDLFGNPTAETFTRTPDNGIDYRQDAETQVDGKPTVEINKVHADQNGLVTAMSSNIYNNTTVATTYNNAAPTQTTTSQTIDTSNLAKESTLSAIKSDLDVTSTPDVSTADSSVLTDLTGLKNQVDSVSHDTTIANPSGTAYTIAPIWNYADGTCYPAEFDMGRFGTIKLDKFCAIWDEHAKPLLIFLLACWAVLHAFYYWTETVKSSMDSYNG